MATKTHTIGCMISIYAIPLLLAMFLAINMGGSGTAPTFAAAYGANLIRRDLIPGFFGIFVFLGAVIAGQKVIATVGGDVLPAETVNMTLCIIIVGSIGLAMFFANMLKVPQSTSQATIFALAGPALYLDVLQTRRLFFEMIPTWFITPLLAFGISYGFGRFVYNPLRGKLEPILSVLRQHRALQWFVVSTACYVSFSIGSNNIANAVAPVLVMAVNILGVQIGSEDYTIIMLILVFMLAPMFGLGSSLLGKRVLETTGKDIAEFGPLGASYISIITATILLTSSLWRGIPASLVQMNTAAVIGLSMVKKSESRKKSKNGLPGTPDQPAPTKKPPLARIFTVWLVSPLIAMALSLFFTWLADAFGWI